MKVITLWQPWASLIACGAKRIETRSWPTSYRGSLAIHAAKNVHNDTIELWHTDANFRLNVRRKLDPVAVLSGMPIGLSDLPAGEIVATCELVGCEPITDIPCIYCADGLEIEVYPGSCEYLFGDYTPGRYAWILDNIRELDKPIPARGKQGLWEWDAPEEVGNG